MSELYIDCGNTALKWQLVERECLLNQGVFSSEITLSEGFSTLKESRLVNIYVSSVAAEAFCCDLQIWAKERQYPAPTFVESTRKACGVVNAYQDAAQLGVDRWLAMIAAHHKYTGMLCVVDTGTALTMDFLLGSGQHLGGFIVPGAELMRKSLLNNTHKINIEDTRYSSQLGKNTSEAVTYGVEQMLMLFVREKVVDVGEKHQQPVTTILTGGHATVLAEGLLQDVRLEKDLVLQGLQLVTKSYQ